jgi:hypothetical protein
MSVSLIQSVVILPQSPFPPLAVGFMGLGTGYLIYGTQELFGYPGRDDRVDFATGIWMPGFRFRDHWPHRPRGCLGRQADAAQPARRGNLTRHRTAA